MSEESNEGWNLGRGSPVDETQVPCQPQSGLALATVVSSETLRAGVFAVARGLCG
jgi:hypothetical protein